MVMILIPLFLVNVGVDDGDWQVGTAATSCCCDCCCFCAASASCFFVTLDESFFRFPDSSLCMKPKPPPFSFFGFTGLSGADSDFCGLTLWLLGVVEDELIDKVSSPRSVDAVSADDFRFVSSLGVSETDVTMDDVRECKEVITESGFNDESPDSADRKDAVEVSEHEEGVRVSEMDGREGRCCALDVFCDDVE